jgi:hypothetical protein
MPPSKKVIAPHEVPARANIAALRSIGVRSIIAFSAVGSLQEEMDVSDNATLEESPRAHALGAVNDLVRDNKVAGLDL